jgi:hypothetical protein
MGGGPSARLVDIDKLKGRRVIAVNGAFQIAEWFDIMLFGDEGWFQRFQERLRLFGGLKVTAVKADGRGSSSDKGPYLKRLLSAGIKPVRRVHRINGLSSDPTALAFNQNSGSCAINLAALLGAGRIVLFGFDMRNLSDEELRSIDEQSPWSAELKTLFPLSPGNWHNQYGTAARKSGAYTKHLMPFPFIARDLRSLHIDCVNATPDSMLKEFPVVAPEAVL